MVETHLVKEQVIELPGYTWYGNNRAKHKKAIRGSGGVGILCKDTLLHQFSILFPLFVNNSIDCSSCSITLLLIPSLEFHGYAVSCLSAFLDRGIGGLFADVFWSHLLAALPRVADGAYRYCL